LLTKMSVLVFGAGGYIGFAVAKYLRARGYTVYGLIRKPEHSKKLSQHEIHPVIGDITKPETYEKLLEQCKFIIDTSPSGQQVAFPFIKKYSSPQSKKIYIFTSGVLVHGTQESLCSEDQVNPPKGFMQDRANYEQQVVHSPEIYGIVIRPGFVYGYAGGNCGLHVDAMFNLSKNQGKIVVKGNKNRKHTWVHIYDLAHAYLLTIEHFPTASGQIFDIAYSYPTYEEIYRKAAAVAGFPNAELVESPFPPENSWGPLLNMTILTSYKKAQNLLGWTPAHPNILDDLEPLYEAWKSF